METYYTIYKVTNKISGKFYIGAHKTTNLDDGYMGSGKYLLHAINKHGIQNFTKEILFVFEASTEMYEKEAEIVNEDFLAEENTYNLKIGGFGGFDHINNDSLLLKKRNQKVTKIRDNTNRLKTLNEYKQTDEYKKHMSAVQKARFMNHPGTFLGKTHTDKSKQQIGQKNSKHQSGKGNSQYGSRWIHNTVLQKSKKIKKLDPLPDGWVEGRKLKF